MKKWIAAILAVTLVASAFAGCGTTEGTKEETVQTEDTEAVTGEEVQTEDTETVAGEEVQTEVSVPGESGSVSVMALKGPTAMGMVKLMSDDAAEDGTGNRYEFQIVASVDEVTPALVQGTVDIAAVPANLASVLYNNTDGAVEVLAINTLGVLYIVEDGDTIQSIADLKGRTIYASGKGATPEYALNYILEGNGIDPETDVTIEWKSEHTECLNALASEEGAIAMLPQPFVTTAQSKLDGLRVALDLNEEWDALQDGADDASALLTGVVVARREFVDANPDAVMEFLAGYEQSVDYINANPTEGAALVGAYDIVDAAVAEKAIPACSIVYIDGSEMEEKLSGYLEVLYGQNPQSIGGALPAEDFYFVQE